MYGFDDNENFFSQLLNTQQPSFMQPSAPRQAPITMHPGLNTPGMSYEDIQNKAYADAGVPQGRKRASLLDILGGLADAVAEVGGSEAGYRTARDAQTQRDRQAEADQMEREKFGLQKQKYGQEVQQSQVEMLGKAYSGIKSLYDRFGAQGVAAAMPRIQQIFGLSPEQAQYLAQNPEEGLTALQGLVSQQAPEMKYIEGPDGTYAIDPRNPTAQPIKVLGAKPSSQSSDIQEYQFAMQGIPEGQRPDFTSWMRQNKASGATRVSVNSGQKDATYGEPPKDMTWARTPSGQVMTEEVPGMPGVTRPIAVPIAGSKDDYERNQGAAKEGGKEADKKRQGNIVISNIKRAKDAAGFWTTGYVGSKLSDLPGTSAHDLQANLATIKANIGYDALQRMRDNSPTGGALGQVTEYETKLLQQLMSSVEQSQSTKQFKENLDILERQYDAVVNGGKPSKGTSGGWKVLGVE